MPDAFLSILCFAISLVAVLAVVTVVGHGLWLMFATFFGRGEPAQAKQKNEPQRFRSCVGCGCEYFTRSGDCEECGLDPKSDAARELKDLVVATRTVQRLMDARKVSNEVGEQIFRSIESRQSELLPRRQAPKLTPIQQLEAWFGDDLGEHLTVEQKKLALAKARTLLPAEMRELSSHALVGVARLFTSVGMLSRACQAYDELFSQFPNASITVRSAVEAFRVADSLNDSARTTRWAEILREVPNLLVKHPELEQIINAAPPILEVAPEEVAPLEAAPVEKFSVASTEPTVVAPAPTVNARRPRHVEREAPIEPPAPRRSFAEWIGVFMEERNIMWGELIGGTLIVGCSIALVISLWSTLQQVIPIFPFIILAAVTSALFAAGLYTLHHWKLESTSRGLLVIGTLLIPLNFLVLAGLTKPGEAGLIEYLSEAATLAVFSWLLYRSSHVLIQTPLALAMPSAGAFTVAMLVSATAQLFAPRWVSDPGWGMFAHYLLSLLPVFAFAGATGWLLWGLLRVETWTTRSLASMLFALGSLTFACGVNLSFVIWAGSENGLKEVLLNVSPALTLLGVPVLIAGTLIHQRLTHAERETFALWRTIGTAIALAGMLIMFAGFAVSVDSLPHRWFTGALNIATLLGLAWTLRLPILHVPMQVYLAALVVFGFEFDPQAFLDDPIAAPRLSGLIILQAILAEWLVRFERRRDAQIYAIGSAVSTALSIITMFPFAMEHPGTMALVLGGISAVWIASNVRWRIGEITYACVAVLGGAFFFASRYIFAAHELPFGQHLLWSGLTLATVSLTASVAMRASVLDWLTNAFRIPLQFASLFATIGVAALLIVELSRGQSWAITAIACGWLAVIWAVVAVLEGWPILFSVFQAALGFTWFFAIGAYLSNDGMGWNRFEPHTLHIYALGLAALSLMWELTRVALRSQPSAMALLTPPFVPLDRVTSGVLIVLQFGLTMILSVGAFGHELRHNPAEWQAFPADWHEHAFSVWVWLISIVLACVLTAWLREFDLRLPAIGLTLMMLTVPLLVAGTWFDGQLASASAARWGLSFCYGIASMLLWNRHRLGAERAALLPVHAIRGLLIAGAIVPTLFITVFVAQARIRGENLPGPIAESIFGLMRRPASILIPLALVSAAFAGTGFRERATRYLFAAGILINLGCVGGLFLFLKQHGISFGEPWVAVDALLLSASVAWIWSIAWSWGTRLLEKDGPRATEDPRLLTLNAILGVLPLGIVLARSVVWIMFLNDDSGRIWTQETGSPWGWITFALAAGGSAFLTWNRRSGVPLYFVGSWGLIGIAMSACSFEFVSPGTSSVALMFGSGVFACVWVWFTMFFDPNRPPRWIELSRNHVESATFATLAASLAIVLGCGFVFRFNEHAVWSANSVILGATAFALLAYQLKRDVWSTLATLAMMIASTILAMHFAAGHPQLFLCVVLAALAVLGASSLIRLALHRVLHADEVDVGDLHLLPLQIFWGLVGILTLSGGIVIAILFAPAHPDAFLRLHGDLLPGELIFLNAAGWLALLTNVLAAIWYVGRTRPWLVVHTFAISGLSMGAALALSADMFFEPDWLAHHLATLTWTLLALAILFLSWLSHAQDAIGPQFWMTERRLRLADWLRHSFPVRAARFWVTLCGAIVVMFALPVALVEPARPYWSIGNTLAICVLLGTLAIWTRAPFYTYASGLLVNVIGLLLFNAWSAHRNQLAPFLPNDEWLSVFALVQILCFAASAVVWSAVEWMLVKRGIDLSENQRLPYSQFAILAGIHLLAVGVGFANGMHLSGDEIRFEIPFAWIDIAALAGAALLDLWRARLHRFTRFQLYTCGLMGIGILLLQWHLAPPEWCRLATLILAGYVLLNVVLGRIVLAIPALHEVLDLSSSDDTSSIAIKPSNGRWFWHAQLLSIGVVVAMSFWITNSFDSWQSRLSGAIACGLVTKAAFLLVQIWRRISESTGMKRSLMPQYLALTLALLVSLEVGWALLDVGLVAISMQRAALSYTTVVAAMFLFRFGLPRLLRNTDWVGPSAWMGSILGVASVGMLLVLLGFEFVAYDAADLVKRTPLLVTLAIPSSIAILALAGLALYSALTKARDPFGVEDHRRSWYVYLAELLFLLLLTHLRLNVPKLLPPVLGEYWYLSVSVLSFIGIAFAEIFKRKDLSILAVPLKRSAIALALVPVIAFRMAPLARLLDGLRRAVPGIVPFLEYLERMGKDFQMEALCWLLLGIFLGTLARMHRSANFGIVAALAINFGIWVLLGNQDATAFLERPQLWLIPLGLIVLVAEYINRDRLGFYPSLSVRYVGLLLIYLSSTIEMFMEQLSPLFAIVLAIVAVVGMLLGILFRVRAFLLAGFLALLVVIFAQIWNAAVIGKATWVWWASGIVLGVIILVMFALFEKHRNEVAKILDNMKRWQ